MFNRIYFSFLTQLIITCSFAQQYPVKSSLLLHPPFSSNLSDYRTPSGKMSLILTLMDYSFPSYSVKLKFFLKGPNGIEIKSKDYYFSEEFVLTPGLPLLLEGEDFTNLLSSSNLDFSGITESNYENNQLLPEGDYEFSIETYDFTSVNPIPVSDRAIAHEFLILYEVPQLNTPSDNSQLDVSTNSQVLFSWIPRHLGVARPGLIVDYTFELWDIFPSNIDPLLIVSELAPSFSYRLPETSFVYDFQFPPLIVGRSYIWRVRANVIQGLDLFKNAGCSFIHSFTFGSIYSGLNLQLNLRSNVINHSQVRLRWDSLGICENFQLQYKRKGNFAWVGNQLFNSSFLLNNLESETNYLARIRAGLAGDNYSEWSDSIEFKTLSAPVFNCNDQSTFLPGSEFKPLKQASTGVVFKVGLFDLRVIELVNYNSSDGRFSGKGIINMPFNLRLGCSFNDILVDENQIVYAGQVMAISQGISTWLNSWMNENPTIYQEVYNGIIDSVFVNGDGSCVIYGSGGSMEISPSNYPFIIHDSVGNSYQVNADGSIQLHSPGSTTGISDEIKRIYRLALRSLRNEFNEQKIEELQQKRKQTNDEFLLGVENKFQIQFESDSDFSDLIVFSGTKQNFNSALQDTFKKAELSYLISKVIHDFSNCNLQNSDYQILANGFLIHGKKSIDYIKESLQNELTEAEIILHTRTALLSFIAQVVKTKIQSD